MHGRESILEAEAEPQKKIPGKLNGKPEAYRSVLRHRHTLFASGLASAKPATAGPVIDLPRETSQRKSPRCDKSLRPAA
jgi:hypothetical protein